MAEIVASIIGISTFGIKLTDTLYRFGCAFSAARDQTSRISQHIIDFTTILDILSSTIDDEASFISEKAIVMIQKLCDQSSKLFYDIEDRLPPRREIHGRESISLKDKIMWNFRKSRVELLLGQLDYVKSNVLLLVMTTLVGKKLRSRRKRKGRLKDRGGDDAENLRHQTAKTRNVIVQHMNAGEKLEKLKNDAIRADELETASEGPSGALVRANTDKAIIIFTHQAEVITSFQNAMMNIGDPAQRQGFAMDNSGRLLEDLLTQWTTFDVAQGRSDAPSGLNDFANTDSQSSRLRPPGQENTSSRAERDSEPVLGAINRMSAGLQLSESESDLEDLAHRRDKHADTTNGGAKIVSSSRKRKSPITLRSSLPTIQPFLDKTNYHTGTGVTGWLADHNPKHLSPRFGDPYTPDAHWDADSNYNTVPQEATRTTTDTYPSEEERSRTPTRTAVHTVPSDTHWDAQSSHHTTPQVPRLSTQGGVYSNNQGLYLSLYGDRHYIFMESNGTCFFELNGLRMEIKVDPVGNIYAVLNGIWIFLTPMDIGATSFFQKHFSTLPGESTGIN